MRDTSSRRENIISMLNEKGSVQVAPLAEQFNVSTQTIRKDLKFLADKGIATRSYGGAMLSAIHSPATEAAIELKQQLFMHEKAEIGEVAASFIKPGDSIILDSGTTTLQIAAHMKDEDDVVVVTNDFGIMNELARCEKLQLLMLGGTLRRKSMSLYGAQTDNTMKNLLVDKLFLGVDGFDMQKGVTTHYEAEASLNRKMCTAANEIILVTDSSKFGKICLHKILETKKITKLITDHGVPRSVVDGLKDMGIEVIQVGAHDT